MSALTPPQAAQKWTHSAEDILQLTQKAIEENTKVQELVGALLPEDCTFQSVRR